jgi:hypothetical protein
MCAILDDRLSAEQRALAVEDLHGLFPVTDKSTRPRFRVVPPENVIPAIPGDLPQITPLCLHQLYLKNIDMRFFVVPPHGLLNLHLYLQEICFSGFGIHTRDHLRDLVLRMGGLCAHLATPSIRAVVAKDPTARLAAWARDHGIPVVRHSWLEDLSQSRDDLDIASYSLNGKLIYQKLAFTSFSKRETVDLTELVKKHGASVARTLCVDSTVLVVPESHKTTVKIRKAASLGIPITTAHHLRNFLDGASLALEFIYDPLVISDLFQAQSFRLDERCLSVRAFALAIKQNGGGIGDSNFTYSISCSCSSPSPQNRTPIWVERCIDEAKLLAVDIFPLYVPPVGPVVRLEGVDVSVTGFQSGARLDVISAVKWLGMTYRSVMTKKSRFLIAAVNESEKITTALKWGIHVVGIEWLFAVAGGHPVDDFDRFVVKRPPIPELPKPASFLSDDDDELPSQILAQIDSRPIEDSIPTDTEREKTEGVVLATLSAGPVPVPHRTNFLSDSSDSDPLYDVIDGSAQGTPNGSVRSLEDLSKTIKAHRKVRRSRSRLPPRQSSIDMLGEFTQRSLDVDADEATVVVGYDQERRSVAERSLHEDPLLELMNNPDSR